MCGDEVFQRKTKTMGVLSAQPPIVLPEPKL